jgi:hypothetical protein
LDILNGELQKFGKIMLHDLFRDGHIKLVKCAGTQIVADALTKGLPAFEKHREYLVGTKVT